MEIELRFGGFLSSAKACPGFGASQGVSYSNCLVILEGFKSRRGWVRNSVLQDGVTVGERVPHLFFKHMNLILDHNGGVY